MNLEYGGVQTELYLDERLKRVFVMPSYVGIQFLLENFDLFDKTVLFITPNPSMKVFLFNAGIPFLELPVLVEDYSFANMQKQKIVISETLKGFQHKEVIYFFYLSSILSLYAIKYLSRKNDIVFIDLDPILKKQSWGSIFFKKNIWISILAYKIVYGICPNVYSSYGTLVLGKKLIKATLPEKYNGNKKGLFAHNVQILKERFNLAYADILFIDNTSIHYPEQTKQIVDLLKKLQDLGYSIRIKPHPTFEPIQQFNKFEKINSSVPSEICWQFAKVVIGVSSQSLNSPLNKSVISLIELANFPVPFRKEVKGRLNSKVQIPTSEFMLRSILYRDLAR